MHAFIVLNNDANDELVPLAAKLATGMGGRLPPLAAIIPRRWHPEHQALACSTTPLMKNQPTPAPTVPVAAIIEPKFIFDVESDMVLKCTVYSVHTQPVYRFNIF